jgi:hypothetical protein
MSLIPSNVVSPDALLVNGSSVPFGPCPSCGATPHEAPEGVSLSGDPHWTFPHCFKCGFRQGHNVAVDIKILQDEFEAFQAFRAANYPNGAVGLTPPSSANEVETLKAQLAEAQARIAADEAAAITATSTPAS